MLQIFFIRAINRLSIKLPTDDSISGCCDFDVAGLDLVGWYIALLYVIRDRYDPLPLLVLYKEDLIMPFCGITKDD